ncbi:MAG TPA: DUF2723 domain-containing protein [Caldilineae bacterium]|nr:DUF2723 domain-containing protein [Caldilineae bacterium]
MRRYILAAAVYLASLILYLATLAPTVVTIFDDSLELQLAVPTLAIIHPTGYPLYELLAWLTTRLVPFGDAAYRVNLFSALAAAAAIMLLYLVARRLHASEVPALAATALLAVSPVWHSQATIAEVYTFQGAITLFILYAFLRWGQNNGQGKTTWLMLGALGVGMGLAHHRLTFLILPGLLLYVVWADRSLLTHPRGWGKPLIALALPLLTYALLPLRAHVGSLDGAYQQLGFWRWIAGGGYGAAFIFDNPFGIDRSLADLLTLAQIQFGWLGVAVMLLSLPWWVRRPRKATLLVLIALADLAFACVYKVQDIQAFLIPLFLVMALWIALGLDAIWRAASGGWQMADGRWRMVAVVALAGLMLIWPARLAYTRWEELDRSQPPLRAWGVHDYGLDMLSSAAPDGRVVGLLGEMTLIRYFQFDRGMAPGVETAPADEEAQRLEAIAESIAEGRATLTTRPLTGLPQRFSLSAMGALIRVWPAGRAQPPAPAHPQDEAIMPGVKLVGWDAILRQPRSGPSLRVLLWWRADAPPIDFKVSARLLAHDGELIAQQDAIPVYHAYPSALWRPGEIVLDAYNFALSSPPDPETTLLLILYNPMDGSEYGRWQTPLAPAFTP